MTTHGAAPNVVDVHTHFIPRWLAEDAASTRSWQLQVKEQDGLSLFVHDQGYAYPVTGDFFGGSEKLRDMEERSIDFSLLSVSPTLFYYWISDADAIRFAQMANDDLASIVSEHPDRLGGLATVPMQSSEQAASELYRAVRELGLVGVEIGTSVEDRYLDDAYFEPFWRAVNDLRIPVMLHPYYIGPKKGFESFYLTNSFGNPLDTAVAGARLMMSGLLDRYPEVKIVLVHGGGFLPYQLGRLDHAFNVRPEPKVATHRSPSSYLEHFYFDTITHNDSALAWLVDFVGADHVALGTDLPFDMADDAPVQRVERVFNGGPGAAPSLLRDTAASLFRLPQRVS